MRKGAEQSHFQVRRQLGPRRTIVAVVRVSDSIFSPARVRYECGHEGRSWSGRSAPSIGAYGYCRRCLEATK